MQRLEKARGQGNYLQIMQTKIFSRALSTLVHFALPVVNLGVLHQPALGGKRLAAHHAQERLVTKVSGHVHFQVRGLDKLFVAVMTLVRPLVVVQHHVVLQAVRAGKLVITDFAAVLLLQEK